VTFVEQELGIPLFVREHRTMRLTPEGESLHDHQRGSDRRQDLRRLEETAELVNQ
jgi:DNA-binding transcriptional LysR family regulator